MQSKRAIEYKNIADLEALNRSALVKKGFAEVNRVLCLFDVYPDTVTYIPVQYLYCNTNRQFYRMIGWEDRIVVEQLAATLEYFEALWQDYGRYFVSYDPETFQSIKDGEMEVFETVWEKLFTFFIPSFLPQEVPAKPWHFLIAVYPVQGRPCIIDLTTVFDLQYRFVTLPRNIPYYALSVAGAGLADFAERLVRLFKPLAKKTLLLYGFNEHYSTEAISNAPEFIRSLALEREAMYERLLENAKQAGVTLIDLQCDEDLLACFRKGKEGYFVQIVAHYIHSEDAGERRLLYKDSSIRYDILEHLLREMKEEGLLRDDIIMDAVTCTNFFDFRSLYAIGVRYLCMSLHDFDTDQAAIVLNELYTGINARRLGWSARYLDGTRHLHEARSNVYRCFFTLEKMGQPIYT
jgi:hypothetical protein